MDMGFAKIMKKSPYADCSLGSFFNLNFFSRINQSSDWLWLLMKEVIKIDRFAILATDADGVVLI